MPSSKTVPETVYTIFDVGQIRTGTARDLLAHVLKEAGKESEKFRKLSVERYAATIVGDADYFIDATLLKYLQRQRYASDAERALEYLAQMPSSGIRILARKAA